MAGEERFYYSVQEFLRIFFAYGFKKNVHPHECAKPNAPPKKKSQRARPVSQWRIVQRIAGLDMGKEKWGVTVSDCFCAYAHRTNRGIFFVREIYHSVSEIFKKLGTRKKIKKFPGRSGILSINPRPSRTVPCRSTPIPHEPGISSTD
jgi:hypothetical protein